MAAVHRITEKGPARSRPPGLMALPRGGWLRRWRPDDLAELLAVKQANHARLRPWMPWADQPATAESTATFLAESVGSFRSGSAWNYAVIACGPELVEPGPAPVPDDVTAVDGGAIVGACGLMARVGPGALEIGYWLAAEATGRGLMTDVVRSLAGVGFGLPGIERIEIHCDAANAPSAADARRAGFVHDRDEPVEPQAPAETGRSMIWLRPR
jgi:RimJ/RimL family protein N-acetyltransferase